MAIKDPLMFITIQEFKSWNGFNKLEFDEITTPDSEIFKAISIASNNIDYLSGFTISPKWPEITSTDFTDEIQTATAYYVNFLLTKDVNYLRGQASISQGGITYSENNPDDPYFIVPEVFSCLRKIKHYLTFKGFPLNVSPRKSNTFFGNGGNENIFEEYVKINLLKSSDPRVEIKKIHQKNINGVIIDFDTTGIKTDIDNSLWEVDKDNPNFIKPKDDKGINVNGKRIIDVGTPTFLSDATTKVYVDNLLDKKQNKLIAGENIKIDENNKISATSGKVDLSDYYKKEEVDKKLEDTKAMFPVAFQINAVGQEIPTLETTDKTVAGAINEILKKISISSQNIYTKEEVDHLLDDLSRNITTAHTLLINKCVKDVKDELEKEIKDNKKELEQEISTLVNKAIDNKIKELSDRLFDSKEQKKNSLYFTNNIATAGNQTFTYKITPWLDNDLDIPNKKYILDRIWEVNSQIEKWKEVGIKKDVRTIEYNFIKNKKYQVYYNFLISTDLNDFSYNVKEFIYGGNTGRQYLESWEDLSKNIYYLQIYNNTISIYSNIRGKIFKLQELQE